MIETAVILAAGEGSRLRSSAPYNPLCAVASETTSDNDNELST